MVGLTIGSMYQDLLCGLWTLKAGNRRRRGHRGNAFLMYEAESVTLLRPGMRLSIRALLVHPTAQRFLDRKIRRLTGRRWRTLYSKRKASPFSIPCSRGCPCPMVERAWCRRATRPQSSPTARKGIRSPRARILPSTSTKYGEAGATSWFRSTLHSRKARRIRRRWRRGDRPPLCAQAGSGGRNVPWLAPREILGAGLPGRRVPLSHLWTAAA